MQIECLVVRTGLTIVDIKERHLQFMPIPGSLNGEATTSVCDVADDEDIKYLLSLKNFRLYNQEEAYRDLLKRRKEQKEKSGRFTGFSIEKLVIGGLDRGYALVDYRKLAPLFYGSDGQWTQDYQKAMPFKDQSSASDQLSHSMPGKSEEDRGKYPCKIKECGRKFETAIELAEHIKAKHKEKGEKESKQ